MESHPLIYLLIILNNFFIVISYSFWLMLFHCYLIFILGFIWLDILFCFVF